MGQICKKKFFLIQQLSHSDDETKHKQNMQIDLFFVSNYRLPDHTLKLGLAHHSVSPLAIIERGAARVRMELSALWV